MDYCWEETDDDACHLLIRTTQMCSTFDTLTVCRIFDSAGSVPIYPIHPTYLNLAAEMACSLYLQCNCRRRTVAGFRGRRLHSSSATWTRTGRRLVVSQASTCTTDRSLTEDDNGTTDRIGENKMFCIF